MLILRTPSLREASGMDSKQPRHAVAAGRAPAIKASAKRSGRGHGEHEAIDVSWAEAGADASDEMNRSTYDAKGVSETCRARSRIEERVMVLAMRHARDRRIGHGQP